MLVQSCRSISGYSGIHSEISLMRDNKSVSLCTPLKVTGNNGYVRSCFCTIS